MMRIAYSDFKSWGNKVYNYKINKDNYAMSGLGKRAGKMTKASAYIYLFVLQIIWQEGKHKVQKC